jgi:hypothetical protein
MSENQCDFLFEGQMPKQFFLLESLVACSGFVERSLLHSCLFLDPSSETLTVVTEAACPGYCVVPN